MQLTVSQLASYLFSFPGSSPSKVGFRSRHTDKPSDAMFILVGSDLIEVLFAF